MSPIDDPQHIAGRSGPWSAAKARDWYERQPWPLGCNFVPSTAVNQLEMWQAETFDPETIDRELGLAAGIGFNTVRIFLHDLLWADDAAGLLSRLDRFLDLAAGHGLRSVVVFLDGCWNNYGYLGPQPDPVPGVHNSQWLQSPHPGIVVDEAAWGPIRAYVQGVIDAHRSDERVLMWDLYNEPGNEGLVGNAAALTDAAFQWAREVDPEQPLTSPIWNTAEPYRELNRLQLTASDVISFHTYEPVDSLRDLITSLRVYDRPMLCSEFMARPQGSQLSSHLPVLRDEGVGALVWGLVRGRTQTIFPWFSPRGAAEPDPWFHDLFHPDGTPYDPAEIEVIRALAPTRDGAR